MTVLSDEKLAKAFADVPEGWGAMAEANNIGDTKVMWDPNDDASVSAAKAAFDDATRGKKRMVAYNVDDTGQKTDAIVKEFDPALGRMILMPQIQGG
jgi:hypothetical protein